MVAKNRKGRKTLTGTVITKPARRVRMEYGDAPMQTVRATATEIAFLLRLRTLCDAGIADKSTVNKLLAALQPKSTPSILATNTERRQIRDALEIGNVG